MKEMNGREGKGREGNECPTYYHCSLASPALLSVGPRPPAPTPGEPRGVAGLQAPVLPAEPRHRVAQVVQEARVGPGECEPSTSSRQ